MRKLAEDVSVSIYNSLKKYTMSIYNIYLLNSNRIARVCVYVLCIYLFVSIVVACCLQQVPNSLRPLFIHSIYHVNCLFYIS